MRQRTLQRSDSLRRLSGGNFQLGVLYLDLRNVLSEFFPIILSENLPHILRERNSLRQKQ
jgi:hypothetical protein